MKKQKKAGQSARHFASFLAGILSSQMDQKTRKIA
jgi:hypothetical protein